MQKDYSSSLIEKKWQEVWEKKGVYRPDLDKAAKPFYNLMMFPYPSAEGMHVGNMYAFTGADVYGRFQRMQGKDVFEPIGLDGFGIHSENYAIKVGNHPTKQAEISEKNFYRQLKSIGNGFDWSRTVETYKPEYYKWTQWLFVQLFKAGLAYRKKAPVNFCPSCKTVLADEQVVSKKDVGMTHHDVYVDGKGNLDAKVCERCGTEVEKRDLEQWFFKITKYADRLLTNIRELDWSEKVKIAQKQWIGKSEGALVKFSLVDIPGQEDKKHSVDVFTTRPDTLFGATFLTISPELAKKWLDVGWKTDEKVKKYVEKSLQNRKNVDLEKEKTGVFSGIYAINPVNDEKIPVWISDYVLSDYGTGAIMAVPAHDQRDFEFAKKFKLPIKEVIGSSGNWDIGKKAYVGEGKIINSGDWNGWETPKSIAKVIEWLHKKDLGEKKENYHLRDWLISRQRYWGPPIPMIYCEKCSWQPVPEKDLPVELPFIEDYKPLGTGQAPLASHPEFYKTKCPNCKGDARRETDVSDTFLDSAWYFLRYVATEFDDVPFPIENSNTKAPNPKQIQNSNSQNSKTSRVSNFDIRVSGQRLSKWLPVNMYIGGAEHSVLHLLYSRFITMVLKDLGFINFEEPFAKFRAHGLIVKDGAKMSKSKGNVVIPDEYIKKFGADTLRAYLMFAGPYSQGGDFRDSGIEGMNRFLRRIWTLVIGQLGSWEGKSKPNNLITQQPNSLTMMHATIKKVTEDIEGLSYNTAIAALMEYYNFLSDQKSVSSEELEAFAKLLAPFAPHVSEELYQLLTEKKEFSSIHKSVWPTYDPKFLVKDEFVIVVQVNGKLRGNLIVDTQTSRNKAKIEELARKESRVQAHLEGKSIKKVIHVEGKVVNFVAV